MSRALSSLEALPAGVTIRSGREAWQAFSLDRPGSDADTSRAGARLATSTAFSDLNLAFLDDGDRHRRRAENDRPVADSRPVRSGRRRRAGAGVAAPGADRGRSSLRSSIIESYAGTGEGLTLRHRGDGIPDRAERRRQPRQDAA